MKKSRAEKVGLIGQMPDDIILQELLKISRYEILKILPSKVNLGLLLEIFSDARVVAPLVRAANLQSDSERASYLYVFKHTTEAGYYPEHGAGGIR